MKYTHDKLCPDLRPVITFGLSLWEIHENQFLHFCKWIDAINNLYGDAVKGILVSKNTYLLICSLASAKGTYACGNWLDLCLSIDFHYSVPNNVVFFIDRDDKILGGVEDGSIIDYREAICLRYIKEEKINKAVML